jgi:hypothetical protein
MKFAGFRRAPPRFLDGPASAFEFLMMSFKKRRVIAAEPDPLLEETTTIQVRNGEYEVVSGTYERADDGARPDAEPIELSVSDFQLEPEPIPEPAPAPLPAALAPSSPPRSAGDDFAQLLARELARAPSLATRRAAATPREIATPRALATTPALARPARDVSPARAEPTSAKSGAKGDEGYDVPAPRTVVTPRSRRRRVGRLSTAALAMLVGLLAVTAVAAELAPARVAHLAHAASGFVSAALR